MFLSRVMRNIEFSPNSIQMTGFRSGVVTSSHMYMSSRPLRVAAGKRRHRVARAPSAGGQRSKILFEKRAREKEPASMIDNKVWVSRWSRSKVGLIWGCVQYLMCMSSAGVSLFHEDIVS